MKVIFKGISSVEYGLEVRKHPPITQAEVNHEKIEIPGRDGFLTVTDGTRKGISIPVEFLFYGVDVVSNARAIKQWLTGEGHLIFSDEPDKYYKASVFSTFDIQTAIERFGEFVVIFDCQPFAYAVDNNVTALTAPGSIFNPGTVDSEPIITVYGSGDITLTINGENIYLYNVTDYVTIDSVLMDCYKDTQLMNNNMNGDFPQLTPGTNNVSWSGNVTKIEIIPNWRWL